MIHSYHGIICIFFFIAKYMMIPTPINKINHFTTAVKIGP